MHSPKWLFLYPGILLTALGLILMVVLEMGPLPVGSVTFDIQTMLYAAAMLLLGVNNIFFSVYTENYARSTGFIPVKEPKGLSKFFTVEKGLILGVVLFIVGIVVSILAITYWSQASFGALDAQSSMRMTIPGFTAIVLGAELILSSFFIGILQIKHK